MSRTSRMAPVAALAALAALALFAQNPPLATVQKIAQGYRFTDGPAWSRDGFLVFSDTPNDRSARRIVRSKT